MLKFLFFDFEGNTAKDFPCFGQNWTKHQEASFMAAPYVTQDTLLWYHWSQRFARLRMTQISMCPT